ncbi:hypothetical protein JL721_13157 [Aureococcus anophagefferens]|nr:hypothetical protein JL721_13157 [Aureococcus anophagefferens]
MDELLSVEESSRYLALVERGYGRRHAARVPGSGDARSGRALGSRTPTRAHTGFVGDGLRWWFAAANVGNADAYQLANANMDGGRRAARNPSHAAAGAIFGEAPSVERALDLYAQAGARGSADALYALGVRYVGHGPDRRVSGGNQIFNPTSIEWPGTRAALAHYGAAAELGHEGAMLCLYDALGDGDADGDEWLHHSAFLGDAPPPLARGAGAPKPGPSSRSARLVARLNGQAHRRLPLRAAGHGNMFNESFFAFQRLLGPALAAAGVELRVGNFALGGTHSRPHPTFCSREVWGDDVDYVNWDFDMTEAGGQDRDGMLAFAAAVGAAYDPPPVLVAGRRRGDDRALAAKVLEPNSPVLRYDPRKLMTGPFAEAELDRNRKCVVALLAPSPTRGGGCPDGSVPPGSGGRCSSQVKWHPGWAVHEFHGAALALPWLKALENLLRDAAAIAGADAAAALKPWAPAPGFDWGDAGFLAEKPPPAVLRRDAGAGASAGAAGRRRCPRRRAKGGASSHRISRIWSSQRVGAGAPNGAVAAPAAPGAARRAPRRARRRRRRAPSAGSLSDGAPGAMKKSSSADGKLQQLLSLARDRLQAQKLLASREACISELARQLEDEVARRRWRRCGALGHVSERTVFPGSASAGRWILFEFEESEDLEWRHFERPPPTTRGGRDRRARDGAAAGAAGAVGRRGAPRSSGRDERRGRTRGSAPWARQRPRGPVAPALRDRRRRRGAPPRGEPAAAVAARRHGPDSRWYDDLKREYKLYRENARKALKESDAAGTAAPRALDALGDRATAGRPPRARAPEGDKFAYLKNLMTKYLGTADPDANTWSARS